MRMHELQIDEMSSLSTAFQNSCFSRVHMFEQWFFQGHYVQNPIGNNLTTTPLIPNQFVPAPKPTGVWEGTVVFLVVTLYQWCLEVTLEPERQHERSAFGEGAPSFGASVGQWIPGLL